MRSERTTTFAALETQKASMLAGLDEWTPAQIGYRPGPGAWSAPEVFDHLVRVETEILAAVRDGAATPHRLGLRDRAGFAFIDWLFRSNRRVRAPASVPQVLPDATAELTAVCQRWDTARRDLGAFVAMRADDQTDQGVFRHPVSGWMTVPQVLRFFEVHAYHHGYQLARLRAAAGGR